MKKLITTVLMMFSIWAYSQMNVNVNAVNETATRSASISTSSYPNPAYNGNVNISIHGIEKVGIVSFYSLRGEKIGKIELEKSNNTVLNYAHGVVLYQYQNKLGQKAQGKIMSFSDYLVVSVENFPAENMFGGDGVLKSFVAGMNPIISALDGSTLGVNGNKIVLDALQMDWNLVDYAPDPQYSYIVNPANGKKLSTDASGNLSFRNAGASIPRVRWEQIDAGGGQYYLRNVLYNTYLVNDGAGNVSCSSTTEDLASTWSFETITVSVPFVNILYPTVEENTFAYGTDVVVTAEAGSPNGVSQLRMFVDDVLVETIYGEPYSFTLSNLSLGDHTLEVWLWDGSTWTSSDIITINITSQTYPLTVSSGTSEGDGEYAAGEEVAIHANTYPGWIFDHWELTNGGGTVTDASAANTTYTMPNNAAEITAKYRTVVAEPITLPIEVMGAPGHIEAVTLDIGVNSAQAEDLWVQVHNISYDTKARLRVNGGSWITMTNNNAQVNIQEPDKSYGGFGGGFSVIRFKVNKSDISFVNGGNLVEFQYYQHVGPTAGYRVIKLNILDGSGNKMVAEENFQMDDPTAWTGPYTDAASIAEGKALWETIDLANTEASCTHCHTNSGMDLKYFNVSNKTIIQQAMKSNLSEEVGKKIASYIRSIDIPVVPQARIWNPAYQPGPGIDSKPVYEWAAGAGIDAVLDTDEEMLPYIFADGSRASIDAVTDTRATMNLREMPVAVQFPDWLKWIPRTHPIDIWGKDYWENSTGYFGEPWTASPQYPQNPQNELQILHDALGSPENANLLAQSGQLISTVERFANNTMWWLGYHEVNSLHPWCALDAPTLNARDLSYSRETAKHYLATWQSIKMWEVMMKFELQDKAIVERPTVGPENLTGAEKYNWPCNRFIMFVIPAHFTGDFRGTSHFQWESQLVGTYFSSIWYQVQMTVNSGMRSAYKVAPVDWAYNAYHVNLLGERSGVYEPLRMAQNIIKCYQQRDKETNGVIDPSTWNMREVSPWRIYSDWKGHQGTMSLLDSYDVGLRGRITSSIIAQFVSKSSSFDLNKWPRTPISKIKIGSETWEELEEASYDPTGKSLPGTTNLFSIDGSKNSVEAIAIYRLLDGNYNNGQNRLEEIDVDPVVIGSLANWADQIWTNPATDWYTWE